MSSSSIINKVKHWCKDLLQLDYPTHSSGFHDSICFQVMHIPMVSPNIPKGKWIKWAPPPFGILKLNTDGSSRNGMAAGGGGTLRAPLWLLFLPFMAQVPTHLQKPELPFLV